MKYILLLFISFPAFADESGQWFCEQTSYQRNGNELSVCGMGVNHGEANARSSALLQALRHFNALCSYSADCNPKKVIVSPGRTSCKKRINTRNAYDCTTLIVFTLMGGKE